MSRARFRFLLLGLPALLVVGVDAWIRADRLVSLRGKYIGSYVAAFLESAILWALLLYCASHQRGWFRWVASLLFVALATVSIGSQIYFHRQYSTYVNLDATLFGTSVSSSVFGQLKADGAHFLLSTGLPCVTALLLVVIGRLWVRPNPPANRMAAIAAGVAVISVFLIPCSYRTVQASTPDVIYFHAMGGLIKELAFVRTTAQVRPGLRTVPPLPALSREPAKAERNVLFILTESVRADAVCSRHQEDCPTSPFSNEALPNRFSLDQARSNSSTTAIELAVMWSGLPPTSSRTALHSAPLLFNYADAAGMDSAYWTSHHMMFANSRLFVQDLPTSKKCGATDLDPLADIDLGANDELLTARIKRELTELREPFFAVAHYGNTHVPYREDPNLSPFQPSSESKAPEDNEAYRNRYKNAVYAQDKTIADLIQFVRASNFGERTAIVFTSDHGEAFREHGQLCHTGAILDEEIHVPMWIDAPSGLLEELEEQSLREMGSKPVFHTDLTPTVLDMLGLWTDPAVEPYRAAMPGRSLIRPARPPGPIALTNCTEIWGCAFRNWGMMDGFLKLEAREWDTAWHCYDVSSDPSEKFDLGVAACKDLPNRATQIFGGLPGAR